MPIETKEIGKERLLNIAKINIDEVFSLLKSSVDGISDKEVKKRLKKYGLNKIANEKPITWYRQLFDTLKNPFNILLLILAIISFITKDMKAAIVLSLMVLLSSILRFYQEFRSNKAAEKLKALVSTKANVIRNNINKTKSVEHDKKESVLENITEVSIKYLVPGDIIHLSAGDMIPGDARLIHTKDLFVSQSALTGEAFPVEKNSTEFDSKNKNPLELSNICFMGSNIVSGSATAIIVNTGKNTYLGSLSDSILNKRDETDFEKGINKFSWLLIRFMIVMVPSVFLINGLLKGNWMESLLFSIAVAVGLTPEMLPMIVSANLAKGAIAMSNKKVIVKRLNSIQNFGAMDVLCTDKTGTLTQDKVVLLSHLDIEGNDSEDVLQHAYLNSHYQTGLKNLLDLAILKSTELVEILKITTNYKLIDEIPFDFVRRRMSVVIDELDHHHELICKGAVEEIYSICKYVKIKGEILPIDNKILENLNQVSKSLNEDGLRVIAIAYKEINEKQREYSVKDEIELILLGYVAFLDPPKESASPAILALNNNGVTVKILTGDNEIVTRKICKDVGIKVDKIILGSDLDKLNDEEIGEISNQNNVFAKLSPDQKQIIVKSLQLKGRVVGFMGDGINDAPALRTADIGISVDTAVDIAKESADIILLEKSLMVLEEGVIEGRKTFGNTVKYIKMAGSSNFGNMFSMIGASALLPFLPMLPIQLLIQNLLYDISQTAIPFDDVDKEYTSKPRKWEIQDIKRFMMVIGPVSSIFDYLTFALMWFVFKANTIETQSLFQSGWFIEGLLSQTLIVHVIRTEKIPFIQSSSSLQLLLTTLFVMLIGIIIPFSPLAEILKLTSLPSIYFLWLLGILTSYILLTQLIKTWFIKKYGFH